MGFLLKENKQKEFESKEKWKVQRRWKAKKHPDQIWTPEMKIIMQQE